MTFRPDIHYFRGFAICGIVLAHTAGNFTWDQGSLGYRIFLTVANESSVWFFFIAGFLFQHLSARFRTADYLTSKWKNVIIPYIIWSTPAIIIVTQFIVDRDIPPSFYDYDLVTQIFLLFVTGYHLGPLWFVPAISLIYLLAPLLLKGDREGWLYYLMIPMLILSAIIGRDGLVYHDFVSPYLRQVDNAVYLLSPYVFGMFCSRYYDSIIAAVERWHSIILITVLVAMVVSIEIRDTREIIPSYRFIFKVISCPLIVYYLKIFQKRIWTGMSILADYSFGIFFIHGFVLAAHRLAFKHLDLPLPPGNIVIVILYSAVVMAICTGALWTVKKLAGSNSRALVGC